MQPHEPAPRAGARELGLELVQGWTVAATVGAVGLTGVLALLAAGTFPGRTVSAAPATSTIAGSPDGGTIPQAPSGSTFGGGTQPPVVVSGGS